MSQVHKRFTSDQVKELLDRYLKNEVERKYLQEILGIRKRRFFLLLKQYKEDPQRFTIQYQRKAPSRNLSPKIENNILKELTIEKKTMRIKTFRSSLIITAISRTACRLPIARKCP